MPNWVFNTLEVSGSPETVKKLAEQLAQPYEYEYTDYKNEHHKVTRSERLSFWNIIKPDDLVAYNTSMGNIQEQFAKDNWYLWNIANWGTKWEPSEVNGGDVSVDDVRGEATYGVSFDTAWSPPAQAITLLSEQYPDADIALIWKEEQGFGGTLEFKDGVATETNSYEWSCWECDKEYQEFPDRTEEMEDNGTCPECFDQEAYDRVSAEREARDANV